MKILITGAAGFVGTQMIDFFIDKDHEVIGVDRNPPPINMDRPGFRYFQQDTTKTGDWQQAVGDADAVINLAGKSIFGRWSEAVKNAILDSRIETTRRVVEALSGEKASVLCNTSAVGYYGDRGDTLIDESMPPGDDFLAEVGIKWEAEAEKAREKGVRVAIMRFGLIMGMTGGALPMMVPAFKAFVGGPMSGGQHFMPWIHIEDLMRAFEFVIHQVEMEGPVNCSAPNPVRNQEFARTLGNVLHRPAALKVPKFALKLAMGEFGELMLNSQRAVPRKLEEQGFEFKFPDLREALTDLLQ